MPMPALRLPSPLAALLAALALVCATLAAPAQDLPRPQSDTVIDFAGLLSAQERQSLSDHLAGARTATGVQIVAVTVESLAAAGGAGQRIEDYAKALFNAWGVGDAARNDGILILVDREGRAVRVALGTAYDPVWDNAAQRVIDGAMLPPLKAGRYGAALQAGAVAAQDQIARPFTAGQPAPATAAPGGKGLAAFLIPGAMIAAFAALVLRSRLGGGGRSGGTGIRRGRAFGHDPDRMGRDRRDAERDDDRRGGGEGGGRSSGGGASGRF